MMSYKRLLQEVSNILVTWKECQVSANPNMLLYGRVHGLQSQGRPRKRWLDNVREDCTKVGCTLVQAVREAHDRTKGRSICKLSTRATASPGH